MDFRPRGGYKDLKRNMINIESTFVPSIGGYHSNSSLLPFLAPIVCGLIAVYKIGTGCQEDILTGFFLAAANE